MRHRLSPRQQMSLKLASRWKHETRRPAQAGGGGLSPTSSTCTFQKSTSPCLTLDLDRLQLVVEPNLGALGGVRSRDSAAPAGQNIPPWSLSREGSQACSTSDFPCRRVPGEPGRAGTLQAPPPPPPPPSLLPGAPDSSSSLREFLIDQSLSGSSLCNCTVA